MTESAQPSNAAQTWKQVLLTCMDPRIDVTTVITKVATSTTFPGWADDPTHTYVLRNAGAVATDDALRSLVMVQRLAASPDIAALRIAVVGHEAADPCAMTKSDDNTMKDILERDPEIGAAPTFSLEFLEAGVDSGVSRSWRRINRCRFIPPRYGIDAQDFVYNTDTKVLRRPK